MGTNFSSRANGIQEIADLLILEAEKTATLLQRKNDEIEALRHENYKLKTQLSALKSNESAYWHVAEVLRFRYFVPSADDIVFEGEALVKLRNPSADRDEYGFSNDEGASDVQILVCFKNIDDIVMTHQPYGRDYDRLLTQALENAAVDAYYNPPSYPVEFPGE